MCCPHSKALQGKQTANSYGSLAAWVADQPARLDATNTGSDCQSSKLPIRLLQIHLETTSFFGGLGDIIFTGKRITVHQVRWMPD